MRKTTVWTVLVAAALALGGTSVADAGCGCEKAPPSPADVRPHATSPGGTLTVFHPGLIQGESYDIVLTSAVGGRVETAHAVARVRRDLADGLAKAQLTFPAPALPMGPVAISVTSSRDGSLVLEASDDVFTLVGAPVAVPSEYGTWTVPAMRAAVGRDGTTYIALDLEGLRKPMILDAQAVGYPLRFSADGVVFYNAEGFVMQRLLDESGTEPVPGMYAFPSDDAASSDVLHYSRHEFATYWLQHEEREAHAFDPADSRWHLDGTPHIDHDLLILSIAGNLPDGTAPTAGSTPEFDLALTARSLFHNGVVGRDAVTLERDSMTDSYDSTTGVMGLHGDVFSNGPVTVSHNAIVGGNATGSAVTTRHRGAILGETYLLPRPESFMEVQIPADIPDLGSVVLDPGETMSLRGPGSFRASDVILYSNSRLYVDNSSGPVTLYLTGRLEIWSGGMIETAQVDPEQFAVYANGTSDMDMWDRQMVCSTE